jgi:hypothetical protein
MSEFFGFEHVGPGHPLRMIHGRPLLFFPDMDADIQSVLPRKFALAGQAEPGLG